VGKCPHRETRKKEREEREKEKGEKRKGEKRKKKGKRGKIGTKTPLNYLVRKNKNL